MGLGDGQGTRTDEGRNAQLEAPSGVIDGSAGVSDLGAALGQRDPHLVRSLRRQRPGSGLIATARTVDSMYMEWRLHRSGMRHVQQDWYAPRGRCSGGCPRKDREADDAGALRIIPYTAQRTELADHAKAFAALAETGRSSATEFGDAPCLI